MYHSGEARVAIRCDLITSRIKLGRVGSIDAEWPIHSITN